MKNMSIVILKSLLITEISKVVQIRRKLNKAVRKKKIKVAKKLKKVEKKDSKEYRTFENVVEFLDISFKKKQSYRVKKTFKNEIEKQ